MKYLKKYLKKYSDKNLLRQAYIEEYSKNKTKINEYKSTLSNSSKELQKINNKLDTLYNDKLNNVISADMYKKYSVTLKESQKNLQNKVNEIETNIYDEEKKLKSLSEDEKNVSNLINRFCELKSINEDVINEFIEKISIDKNRDFHIKLKFDF